MPARPGNWSLLGHPSDPIAGDPDQLHDLVVYYAKIAETIKSEAAVLQRIGSGDTTEMKGQSADAIRADSKSVAGSLTQTSGRYDAVARALAVYGPALDEARTESMRALLEAEAADGAKGSSAAMADPGANRPTDAPPLTDAETTMIHARTTAMADAADAAAQAKRRMDGALSALNAAGAAATGVIRGAWNDGLVDTWQYKLREKFVKFLKMLVKVLMWIGVALAVLAFFIPGLGAAALAGAIVAVATLAATTALAVMGEGSWMDVIFAVVGVVFIGGGVLAAKGVQVAHKAAVQTGLKAAKTGKMDVPNAGPQPIGGEQGARLARVADFRDTMIGRNVGGRIPETKEMRIVKTVENDAAAARAAAARTIDDSYPIKPQWWNAGTEGWGAADAAKGRDFVAMMKGTRGWREDRFLSTDRVGDYKKLQGDLQTQFGITPKSIPWWYYANGGRVTGSLAFNGIKWGLGPTGFGADQVRLPAFEDAKAAMTTPKTGLEENRPADKPYSDLVGGAGSGSKAQ